MIEPTRIVTSGKIKTDVTTVKKNINFWNDLHQLGLTDLREKASAATWHLANCVIAIRKLEASVTEIFLLVTQRQTNYRWFYGLRPEETAQAGWNRLFNLWAHDVLDQSYQPIESPQRLFPLDIIGWAEKDQEPSEFHLAEKLGDELEARYGLAEAQRLLPSETRKFREQIEIAKSFKRDQDELTNVTAEQLAIVFLKMVPANPRPRQRTRRPTPTTKTTDAKASRRPKRKSTEAKWRRDWKLIAPLFNDGIEIAVIAKKSGMSRDRVSRIVQWANAEDK